MANFLKSLLGGQSRKQKVAEFNKMQEDAAAREAAKAAMVNAADSDPARAAMDARKRKLAMNKGLGGTGGGQRGGAEMLFKTLMGS